MGGFYDGSQAMYSLFYHPHHLNPLQTLMKLNSTLFCWAVSEREYNPQFLKKLSSSSFTKFFLFVLTFPSYTFFVGNENYENQISQNV